MAQVYAALPAGGLFNIQETLPQGLLYRYKKISNLSRQNWWSRSGQYRNFRRSGLGPQAGGLPPPSCMVPDSGSKRQTRIRRRMRQAWFAVRGGWSGGAPASV